MTEREFKKALLILAHEKFPKNQILLNKTSFWSFEETEQEVLVTSGKFENGKIVFQTEKVENFEEILKEKLVEGYKFYVSEMIT